jgi:hypothetical protein
MFGAMRCKAAQISALSLTTAIVYDTGSGYAPLSRTINTVQYGSVLTGLKCTT